MAITLLETKARSESPLSLLVRPIGLGNVTKRCAVCVGVRKVEIRMVRCVQRLGTELELDSLRQVECAIERQVSLEEIRTSKIVSSAASETRTIL
jgi:hypothetical protein